eukprot:3454145-Rhodomonas_salina.2
MGVAAGGVLGGDGGGLGVSRRQRQHPAHPRRKGGPLGGAAVSPPLQGPLPLLFPLLFPRLSCLVRGAHMGCAAARVCGYQAERQTLDDDEEEESDTRCLCLSPSAPALPSSVLTLRTISLSTCYAVSGTDLAYGATRPTTKGASELNTVTGRLPYLSTRPAYEGRQALLSAYARAMRNPVLTWHMLLPGRADLSENVGDRQPKYQHEGTVHRMLHVRCPDPLDFLKDLYKGEYQPATLTYAVLSA